MDLVLHGNIILSRADKVRNMSGINLNAHIEYKHASMRFFDAGECHAARQCTDNVLILVFDGVLRFTDDGTPIEVAAGEYYIQRAGSYQSGEIPSDSPRCLYVYFEGEWTDERNALLKSGEFDSGVIEGSAKRLDLIAHKSGTLAECQLLFLEILLSLRSKSKKSPSSQRFFDYVNANIENISSLSDICEAFHYSKNYVIQIFKHEFGTSPLQYINDLKIKRAMHLLESTSRTAVDIATECGFSDYPYFYKRFVQKTGLSPTEWREQIRKNPTKK